MHGANSTCSSTPLSCQPGTCPLFWGLPHEMLSRPVQTNPSLLQLCPAQPCTPRSLCCLSKGDKCCIPIDSRELPRQRAGCQQLLYLSEQRRLQRNRQQDHLQFSKQLRLSLLRRQPAEYEDALRQNKLKTPISNLPSSFCQSLCHTTHLIPHLGQQRSLYQHTLFIHAAVLTTRYQRSIFL